MPYKINEYINDTRIAVHGRNLEQFFNDAFLGAFYLIKPVQKFNFEKVEREISLEAIDTTALLADFLNETISLAKNSNEYYTNVIFYRIQPTSLRAKIFGVSVESFSKIISAPTYHDAEAKQLEDGAWETTLVFNK